MRPDLIERLRIVAKSIEDGGVMWLILREAADALEERQRERAAAIAQAHLICEDHDLPNGWPDELHLADVIEKRIGNYWPRP